jgi:hypothetical protein
MLPRGRPIYFYTQAKFLGSISTQEAKMSKKVLNICIISIMFLLLFGHMSFADKPYYFSGTVTYISPPTITVSALDLKKAFSIADPCRVVVIIKKKGAFFEKPASLADVTVGDHVSVRVVDDTVIEILIERYKK